MNKEQLINTFNGLVVSNAKCMGFLHGIADNFGKQPNLKSLKLAKEIYEFLIEQSSDPKFYYCESFQVENLDMYLKKLIEVNKAIAIATLNELTMGDLIKKKLMATKNIFKNLKVGANAMHTEIGLVNILDISTKFGIAKVKLDEANVLLCNAKSSYLVPIEYLKPCKK